MLRLQQELEELRARCDEACHIAATKTSEVQHLKEANLEAQKDIEHLREAVSLLKVKSG